VHKNVVNQAIPKTIFHIIEVVIRIEKLAESKNIFLCFGEYLLKKIEQLLPIGSSKLQAI
jgi:hypothetical protein